MKRPKLTWLHVTIVGAVVFLIVGGGMFFLIIRPAKANLEQLQTEVTGLESDVNGLKNAPELLEQAKKNNVERTRELARKLRSKAPPRRVEVNLGDLSPAALLRAQKNWWELPNWVGPKMEDFVRKSAKRFHVDVDFSFSVPASSTNPNSIPKDIIAYNLGDVEATGKYGDILRWIENFNRAPLLTTVENINLTLADAEGRVTTTVSVSVFLFPKVKPGAEVAVSGSRRGGGGGGGFGGGTTGPPAAFSGGGATGSPGGYPK